MVKMPSGHAPGLGILRKICLDLILSNDDTNILRKRLRYRATHRGTKEADTIIGGFVTVQIDRLNVQELETLELLLDQSDPDLMDWLLGRQPMPDSDFRELLELMKESKKGLITD